jgi:hypothetical protein
VTLTKGFEFEYEYLPAFHLNKFINNSAEISASVLRFDGTTKNNYEKTIELCTLT